MSDIFHNAYKREDPTTRCSSLEGELFPFSSADEKKTQHSSLPDERG
jgi:hypothetical protein